MFQPVLWAGEYRLTLVLSKTGTPSRVTLTCGGVSGLALTAFGGGLTQVLGLEVIDVHGRQWDRLRYQIRDVEREMLLFQCQNADVSPT